MDSLTTLKNRYVFEKDIKTLVSSNTKFSLYLMGIDNFKMLNDIHGHKFGDTYLKLIANKFKQLNYVKAYRWSGDEIIFIKETCDISVIESLIKNINSIVNSKVQIENLFYSTTCSIGIVMYPKHGKDFKTLYQNLDIALNTAKTEGKNRHVYFKRHNHFIQKIS